MNIHKGFDYGRTTAHPVFVALGPAQSLLKTRFVRKNAGLNPAPATCQVSDKGRVQAHERCESRTIVAWELGPCYANPRLRRGRAVSERLNIGLATLDARAG